MPSGHASQVILINPTNTTGQMDIAADTVDPQDILSEGATTTTRTQEFVDYLLPNAQG